MFSHEIRLSSVEESVAEQILLQLEQRELRILSRKYLFPNYPIEPERIAHSLSRCAEFTLQTKLILTYDSY